MARVKCIGIRETLTSLLPKAEIERLAHESGAVRRRRKVDASAPEPVNDFETVAIAIY